MMSDWVNIVYYTCGIETQKFVLKAKQVICVKMFTIKNFMLYSAAKYTFIAAKHASIHTYPMSNRLMLCLQWHTHCKTVALYAKGRHVGSTGYARTVAIRPYTMIGRNIKGAARVILRITHRKCHVLFGYHTGNHVQWVIFKREFVCNFSIKLLRTIPDFATLWFLTSSVSLRPINGPASFAIVIDHR